MSSRSLISLICCTATFVLLNACSSGSGDKKTKAEGPAAAVETRTYQAVGTVKGLDPKLPSIEIDHEDIKGLMPAMQMWFHVKDTSLVKGVTTGDRVEFSLEAGVGGLKIVAIKKI
jgi:Cu/Ag efflux protein CusF